MSNIYIEELYNKRQKWIESTKDNNFDSGINNLLTELYPDNAHFIYELLQNAEDAEATKIDFILNNNELRFIHNGRVFNNNDVEGITSIGQGTKANDINKIGKFGVGFKAVFSYTLSPTIHSGTFHFKINDLVVPQEIKPIKDNNTVIIFPFNNPNKSKELAYNEIKQGLSNIHDNTLLFLNNIKTINYKYDDISNTLERENINDIKINILNKLNNSTSTWLRFKKHIPKSDILFVSIAYKVEKDEKTNKDIIVPIDGEVSIYFPAEKETSKLKFHIHAPFASTVARDSIKDIEENNELRDMIAALFCESLEYIKKNKFLDFNFLKCLPIDKDNLSSFYKPLQKEIVNAFNERSYMLAEKNKYKPATRCYKASKDLKELIDIDFLKILLFESDDIFWSKNVLNNTREDGFLSLLNIKEFSDSEFLSTLEMTMKESTEIEDDIKNGCKDKNNIDIRYAYYDIYMELKTKSDQWIGKLYSYIYKQNEKSYNGFRDKNIIRLQNNKFNTNSSSCFFSDTNTDDYKIVKKETYSSNTKAVNKNAKLFLEEYLDVKEIGEREEIELLLGKFYGTNKNLSKEEHFKHIERFLNYYKSSGDIGIFRNKKILFDENKDFQRVSELIIDKPYIDTGLKILYEYDYYIDEEKYLLNSIYKDLKNQELFTRFLIELEIVDKIDINEKNIHKYNKYYRNLTKDRYKTKEMSSTKIDQDWTIDNMETLLDLEDTQVSILIWNTIKQADKKTLFARYRPNAKFQIVEKESYLVQCLKKYKWIPDKNGNYFKPEDISKEMLPNEFVYDNRNGWLDSIGFGENIRKNEKDYKETNDIVKQKTGYNLELLEQAKKAGVSEDDLGLFIKQKIESKEIPDLQGAIENTNRDISITTDEIDPTVLKDEEKYKKVAQERLTNNLNKLPNKDNKQYSTIKIKIGKNETREFLKKQYKGYCQICGFTFEQKDSKGKYFELYDWLSEKISKQKVNFIDAGSSLCLCSRCHSGLKYGDFHAKFIEKLKNIDLNNYTFIDFKINTNTLVDEDRIPECYDFIEMDMYKIPIRLLNTEHNIFYTEEHFLLFYNFLTLKENNK